MISANYQTKLKIGGHFMPVQLTLFDLEDYNVQPMAEIIPVGSRVVMTKEKVEYQQLDLTLFPKSPDRKKRMLPKVAA